MLVVFICISAYLFPFFLIGVFDSFFNKCKDKLSLCYTHMGDFSLAHYMLEQKCKELDAIKAVTRCNAIVGRNGLPYVDDAVHDWGEPFSVYSSPGGRKLHLRYGCCGATHAQHLYTLHTNQLYEEKFCSKCKQSLHPDLLPFLRLYRECKHYLRKENKACNLLKCQIPECQKGLMRILYWKEIRRIKREYQRMLNDKEAMINKVSIYLRKGYLGLRGAKFYRVCYSKHPGTGTSPDAPFIAAVKPFSGKAVTPERKFQILRLGFPGGGYILYEDDTFITAGEECRLLGVDKSEKDAHFVYLSSKSLNLLPPDAKDKI